MLAITTPASHVSGSPVVGDVSAGGADDALLTEHGAAADAQKFASGWLKQYRTLFGRELLSITRNPFDVAGRTLTFAWVGIVMGILYYAMPVSSYRFDIGLVLLRAAGVVVLSCGV